MNSGYKFLLICLLTGIFYLPQSAIAADEPLLLGKPCSEMVKREAANKSTLKASNPGGLHLYINSSYKGLNVSASYNCVDGKVITQQYFYIGTSLQDTRRVFLLFSRLLVMKYGDPETYGRGYLEKAQNTPIRQLQSEKMFRFQIWGDDKVTASLGLRGAKFNRYGDVTIAFELDR